MKRTTRLDRAKEVKLGELPNGDPIWSTVGDLDTTVDKQELQDSVNKQFMHGTYMEAARAHYQAISGFFLKGLIDMAPNQVCDDWNKNGQDGEYFIAWQKQSGVNFHLDGLNAFIRKGDRVIAELPVKVPEAARGPLLSCFRHLLVNEANGME